MHTLNEIELTLVCSQEGTETIAEAYQRMMLDALSQYTGLIREGSKVWFDSEKRIGFEVYCYNTNYIYTRWSIDNTAVGNNLAFANLSATGGMRLRIHRSTQESVTYFVLSYLSTPTENPTYGYPFMCAETTDGEKVVFSYYDYTNDMYTNIYTNAINHLTSSTGRIGRGPLSSYYCITKYPDFYHNKPFKELYLICSYTNTEKTNNQLVNFPDSVYRFVRMHNREDAGFNFKCGGFAFPVSDET
jgi:hypothetical protein